MAKGRSSRRGSAFDNSSSLDSLLSPSKSYIAPVGVKYSLPLDPTFFTALKDQQNYVRDQLDRRSWTPAPTPGPAIRSSARLVVRPDKLGNSVRSQLSPRVGFINPAHIAICVRRKIRREVLHALHLTHKSGRGGAPRRKNLFSGIKC